MTVALLTAAGIGSRMHQELPKQFMHVDNKPLIVHTMQRFESHPGIDSIMVVTLESWVDVLEVYARQFGITKLKWVIPGGETGQDSIRLGLEELARTLSEDETVMIHDGNRCLVSAEIISDSLATYRAHGSAIAAIPCVEAVFQSADGVTSDTSIPREELWRTQTPHTYALGKLLWAHSKAKKLGIAATAATCTLMNELGETIWFSKGSEQNLKITTMDDFEIFKALKLAEEHSQ